MTETDPIYMDFEEPADPAPPAKDSKPASGWDDTPDLPKVMKLPEREKPLKPNEVRHGVSQRAKACANMRLEGATFVEIAEFLEYPDAAAAKRDFTRALAATHPAEDWETMRQMEAARAERLFKQSLAMASADYLVDDEGNKVPNAEKLAWHRQAAADLLNHATISGAKAPSKLEITPGEAQLEQLVEQMLQRSGHEVVQEADVLELTQIPTHEGEIVDEDVDFYAE